MNHQCIVENIDNLSITGLTNYLTCKEILLDLTIKRLFELYAEIDMLEDALETKRFQENIVKFCLTGK